MSRKWEISRRSVLRGVGATLSLPLLEAMIPAVARAQTSPKPRLIVNIWPNGLPIRDAVAQFVVDEVMKADPAVRQVTAIVARTHRNYANSPRFLGGHQGCWVGLGTGGDHDYQTWSQNKDPGYRLMSESFDQRIARHFGLKTLSATLERSMPHLHEPVTQLVMEHFSWYRDPSGLHYPVPAYFQPRALFDKLVGAPVPTNDQERLTRKLYYDDKKRVLDRVLEQTRALKSRLGTQDSARLDQYLTGIDELDKKTAVLSSRLSMAAPVAICSTTMARPGEFANGGYGLVAGNNFPVIYRLMTDLMIKAMECEQAQVFSLLNGISGSLLFVQNIVDITSTKVDWHGLSHWPFLDGGNTPNNDPDQTDKNKVGYQNIAVLQVQLFNEFMKKLSLARTADGRSLLDDTVAVLTSEMGDGSGHYRGDVPVILVGTAGGRLQAHNMRLFSTAGNIPVANVWRTLFERLGLSEVDIGDSNGSVAGL